MGAYRDFHRRSIEQREAFWAEQATLVDWHRPFERVLDYSRPPVVLPYARAGRIKILDVTGHKALTSWPDAPPIADAGVPGFVESSWQGVQAPARTPKQRFKLSAESRRLKADG